MAIYLLVDDRNGRVLAELDGPEEAAQLLSQLEPSPDGDPPVSVVRIDDQDVGGLIGASSVVSMRTLPPFMERQPGPPDQDIP
jgi:hypothetical protein